MTEIPEHLLRRSKERRSALGLGGDASGEAGAGQAAEGQDAPAAAAPSTQVAPTTAPAPAPVAAAAPPPPPPPPYVVAAQSRRKIPFWAVPVLAVLPVWGFVYAGSLSTPEEDLSDPVLVLGEQVFAQCSGCHGANGEGGIGRPLNGGEVLLTFPDIEDHVAWVTEGSALVGGAGNPYGNPDRPGGQRVSGAGGYGQMPGFSTLSEEELLAVARYEREVLSGGAAAGEGGATETAGGSGGGAAEGGGEGAAEDGGEGGDAGGGGGSTDDGGAAANEDGAAEDTGSGDDGAGATDAGADGEGGTEGGG